MMTLQFFIFFYLFLFVPYIKWKNCKKKIIVPRKQNHNPSSKLHCRHNVRYRFLLAKQLIRYSKAVAKLSFEFVRRRMWKINSKCFKCIRQCNGEITMKKIRRIKKRLVMIGFISMIVQGINDNFLCIFKYLMRF